MPVRQNPEPIGIDVGIKDIAILSNEDKVENKHFKKQKDKTLRKLNCKLSRRWGPANIAYRDYNRDIRNENRTNAGEHQRELAQPSVRYIKTQQKKAKLERKIARRRNTYYDQKTTQINLKLNLTKAYDGSKLQPSATVNNLETGDTCNVTVPLLALVYLT